MAVSKPFLLNGGHMTFSKFLFDQDALPKRSVMRLTEILTTIQIIGKTISAMTRRIGLNDPLGSTLKTQDPLTLQGLAHDIFVEQLTNSHTTGLLISSTTKHVVDVPKENKGKYIVAFDALSGVSNLFVAITIGSIFMIMAKSDGSIPEVEDSLDSGNEICAAGYILYGTSTIFVLSTGDGVNEFVLDPQIGEFFLVSKRIAIPKKGPYYSVNEGYMELWDESIRDYVRDRKFPTDRKKGCTGRYSGSLTADVHLILKSGGIFLYPSNKEFPNGKLKILCESQPLAFIIKDAGGLETNGSSSLLDVTVTNIHQKSPTLLGSRYDIEGFLEFVAKYPKSK